MKVGDRVVMTDDALDNYGEQWRDVPLEIMSKATRYMPAKEFFAQGKPEGFHPGYDESSRSPLFDLRNTRTGKDLSFSLYEWELRR